MYRTIYSLTKCVTDTAPTANLRHAARSWFMPGSVQRVLPAIFQSSKASYSCSPSNFPFPTTLTRHPCQHFTHGSTGLFTQHCFYSEKKYNPPKPLDFKSGDLAEKYPLDESQIVYRYRDMDWTGVPDSIRRMFTLEYADSNDRRQHRQIEIIKRIESVCGEAPCLEKAIASMTIAIRNMMPHCLRYRGDKINKVMLLEKINKRRKMMKHLRGQDYERFIWLLGELKIKYVQTPAYNRRLSRAATQKKLAREAAIAQNQAKLDELRARFEEEKVEFLEYKRKTMAEIDETCAQFGLDKEQILAAALKKKEDAKLPKDIPKTGFKAFLYTPALKRKKKF